MRVPSDELTRPNRTRVYEDVIRALERLIEEERLQPGDRLPSEAELAARLRVGTRSIREAYTTLRTMGVVEVKHGKGIFLAENSLDFFLESLAVSLKFTFSDTKTLLLELTDVRTLIETDLIRRFAVKRTDEELRALQETLDEMEVNFRNKNLQDFNRSDLAFHTHIVQRSGNRIIVSLYKHLQRLLTQSIEVTQYYGGSEQQCIRDHREMARLIRERNAEEAKRVMTAHLARTRGTIEGLGGFVL